MACCGKVRCRCENVISAVQDTACVDLSGNGAPGTPLTADLTIPAGAVVPHPLAPGGLPDTINGAVCTPTGLMAPQPGFPSFTDGNLPFGSNPDIIANTGGPIPWGPVISASMTNPNSDRVLLFRNIVSFPFCAMVLEPGASGRVGTIFDPLGLALYLPLWDMTNASGAAVERYAGYPQTFISASQILTPAGISTIDGQMWVELTGATGASSITTFGQAGMSVGKMGWPV